MKDKSITILAYTAGLIDGEGYLGLHPNKTSRVSLIPVIKVMSTDRYIVPFLHANFGGSVYHFTRRRKDWALATEWMLRGQDNIKAFLTAIYPYMLVKREQADLLLQYIDECGSFKGKRKFDTKTRKSSYDEEFVAKRMAFAKEFKRLRHQYRAVAETE